MEDGALESDLNIERPCRKSERGYQATANVRADSDNTCDHIVTTVCRVSRRTSSQVESDISNMFSTGTRTILRRADACGRVAAQVDLTRDHVVTGFTESFITTATSRARRLCEESDPELGQSTSITEGHLQLGPDNATVVGDPNFSKVPLGKRETSVTPVNVGNSSKNHVPATCEVFDSNTVEFSRITVCTEDPQREPCGPGPLLGLRPPPRLPDFSAWLPLHHPLPALARPSMHRRQLLRRKGQPTAPPDPCRTLSLLEATSKSRRRPSPAPTKASLLAARCGGLE
ncbi:hypothetical protein MRX96_024309 [Rhipicephalus microplus]